MSTLRSVARTLRAPVVLAVMLVALGAWMRPASAQFVVDELELHFKPDGSGSMVGVIPIHSELDTLQQLRLVLQDWERDSVGGNHFAAFGTLPGNCAGKVEVFPATLQLGPRGTEYARVTYTGRGLPDPGCWGAVSIERVMPPSSAPQGASITISVVVAVKVYAHATNAAPAGEVVSADLETAWQRTASSRDSSLVRQVAVRFANTGTSHLRVKTTLELRDATTRLLSTIEGPEGYITPEAFRDLLIKLPELAKGRYVAVVLLDYGAEEITAAQVEFEVP